MTKQGGSGPEDGREEMGDVPDADGARAADGIPSGMRPHHSVPSCARRYSPTDDQDANARSASRQPHTSSSLSAILLGSVRRPAYGQVKIPFNYSNPTEPQHSSLRYEQSTSTQHTRARTADPGAPPMTARLVCPCPSRRTSWRPHVIGLAYKQSSTTIRHPVTVPSTRSTSTEPYEGTRGGRWYGEASARTYPVRDGPPSPATPRAGVTAVFSLGPGYSRAYLCTSLHPTLSALGYADQDNSTLQVRELRSRRPEGPVKVKPPPILKVKLLPLPRANMRSFKTFKAMLRMCKAKGVTCPTSCACPNKKGEPVPDVLAIPLDCPLALVTSPSGPTPAPLSSESPTSNLSSPTAAVPPSPRMTAEEFKELCESNERRRVRVAALEAVCRPETVRIVPEAKLVVAKFEAEIAEIRASIRQRENKMQSMLMWELMDSYECPLPSFESQYNIVRVQ
ncbi:hypothetical protein GLOTRDRAFT_139223 [Gloeophyllum trabeum ATCC 11539]|uniref:Uncharacterized protein n=1 Tax=Gloeophyllum trabeum (strain ATCC 11539 / FP-39264 / Madison 617) TaxID=670483 RepID=S7Q3X1_GLOTA|nr:uncharacterized protein GLOTRDRAFT_139223 [Gloeophyllum trabeum ATCC 11539]EPQ54701.1 hypothetical protein GLOTRDRAFT_139223 [Gloeophyllum trabeum ATCC 11539]